MRLLACRPSAMQTSYPQECLLNKYLHKTVCVLLTSDSNLCAVFSIGAVSINKANRLTGNLCAAE